VYEGIPLDALLAKAGMPMGDKIRCPLLAAYVMVEAADGYRALFSLAELDSTFTDSDILVADTLDGAPSAPTKDHSNWWRLTKRSPHVGCVW
jgi:hypothetical protein